MFQRILVAINNDDTSYIVFEEAIALAKQIRASVMLLHVLSSELKEPTLVSYSYPVITEEMMQQFRHQWEEVEKAGLVRLKELSDEAISVGLTPEFTQSIGNPGQVICQVAKNWNADLIILGRREQSALGELIMGSTSQFVTRHSSCAVLLIPDANEPGSKIPA
jgi:nucleotide-binding universal stress UspA family protein